MMAMGIDIGSASSKVVILREREITASAVVQSGTGSSGPEQAVQNTLAQAGAALEDMAAIVATGYGRFTCPYTDKQVSEISCHARGVFFQLPQARTIIDIGGQDAKAISMDEKGRVKQFVMNDKCAAGTGRFLEVMSRVLETPLQDLADCHKKATQAAQVSSTCTVFAESEVISLLAMNTPKENIIAGVHQSVAAKACGLLNRVGIQEAVVMSGGVAQNEAVVETIAGIIKKPVQVAPRPQTIGALGAALYAMDRAIK